MFSDEEVLRKLRTGDKENFNLFYERFWEIPFNVAYTLSSCKEFAMDVTQDVFLSIWERKETIEIHNIKAYLKTAARNKFLTWIKQQNRNTELSELIINTKESDLSSDHSILLKELITAYNEVVAQFPPAQQKVFKLRYEEDLSTKQIAVQLNISQKTVQNQIGRSLISLRKSFPTFFSLLLLLLK